LHNVSLLRIKENLARIATYDCASGMRRFILPPRRGHGACNGVEAIPKSILTHGPGNRVFERTSSFSESQCILVPEGTLLESFQALVGSTLTFPRGVVRWQPPVGCLKRLSALHSASTGMSVSTLDRAHGAASYRGLEQQIIAEVVFCLEGCQSQFRLQASNARAEAIQRAEHKFAAIENSSVAVTQLCRDLEVSEATFRRYCLEQFRLRPAEYHNAVRKYYQI
jgi:hypothetical protein